MAAVTNNVMMNGLRGRFGDSLIFRTMRGKTFVTTPARKPDKRKETTAQRSTRTTFRDATQWAQTVLLDSERKVYYGRRAKALKLPNAYTAALTDYMRKPKLQSHISYDSNVIVKVSKKDFKLKKAEVVIRRSEGEEIRAITSGSGRLILKLPKEEMDVANYVRVMDETGRDTILYLTHDLHHRRQ